MYGGRTRFRVVPWVRISILVVAAGSIAAAAYFFSQEGLTLLSASFIGFSIICIAGVVESFSAHILLEESQIRFRETLRDTAIPKGDIVRVTWEAGCGVSLLLSDGTWVKIPDLGHNSQGLTNSIRSWLGDS
ncbi:MAG: hypothetical protein GWP58_09160 [Gammaproteobacteria bacterium]|jgi:hypothetical protein|nr:hypothetical protein [Gammaproteobacteria bacterium]